jgi:glycosyltransferase involved in cell wall biosynthesis
MNWDVVCFSHLRWDFVYQRPQHLMSRAAKTHRVFFVEEPIVDDQVHLEIQQREENLWVVIPHLSHAMDAERRRAHQRECISNLLSTMRVEHYVAWYYTPMALSIGDHLSPLATVYDCMDELSAFKFAPAELKTLEQQLLQRSDVVFTGGYSLYEAKKDQHSNIHPFPSSIDFDHFSKARRGLPEPGDQAGIPHPRIGFCGVIDERMDIQLIGEIAARRKDWHFVMIGPVVKIDVNSLPRLDNIYYLGMKRYEELPDYFSGWDIAIMPFAINESTRYISPTKTPEYLAAGRPVISTPIHDVVRNYGSVVNIASSSADFVSAADKILDRGDICLKKIDELLSENSWDQTWNKMEKIINKSTTHLITNGTLKTQKTYV